MQDVVTVRCLAGDVARGVRRVAVECEVREAERLIALAESFFACGAGAFRQVESCLLTPGRFRLALHGPAALVDEAVAAQVDLAQRHGLCLVDRRQGLAA